MRALFLFVFLTTSYGFTFLSPPPLAGFGRVWSPLYKQLYPFVKADIYDTNVSVVIATDVAGCDASITPAAGKVVWYTVAPCSNLGMNYPKAQKWFNFQAQGAIGIVETMFGSNTEFESGNIFV